MKGSYKKGVDFVFEQNPELSKIGTKEQYEVYLKTVFPDSKVKDIVYHRGPEKIEKFNRSKIKDSNAKRFYFSPFNTGRYGQHITQALLNIKNLALPSDDNFIDDLNKKHPEYTKGKSKWFHLPSHIYKYADKYGYDGVFEFEDTNDDEYGVYHRSQIHVLGSKKDAKKFYKFVNKKSNDSLEKRLVAGIFSTFILAGLFFSIPIINGNIIGNDGILSNSFGWIIFGIGIFGLLFRNNFNKLNI